MSHTPFTIADITSAWAALAWTGEIAYPESVEERLRSEQERLQWIEQARAKEAAEALVKAAHVGEAEVNGAATNGTTTNGTNTKTTLNSDGTLPGAAAKDATTAWTSGPSDGLTYNVFGGYEQEYAAGIRADIVKARPELHRVLPEWNDERTRQREAMYALKYKSLEWARNKREAEARAKQEAGTTA